MAYLSVLGPLKDVVGAHAALLARSRAVVGGQCPEEAQGRGVGAVAADTALRLLSGRAVGQLCPVEVHLVMTDRSLLGTGEAHRSVFEPARIPGHGSVPAPVARSWLREGTSGTDTPGPHGAADVRAGGAGQASVWLRRLYTSASGQDLVAMDSRRRVFAGLLRRMLVLRDDVCVTPWCGAPVVHADHAVAVREGGPTSWANGDGRCARCNHVKEAPGWSVTVTDPGPQLPVLDGVREQPGTVGGSARAAVSRANARSVRPRRVMVRTPTGHVYASSPPPLLGWGSEGPPTAGQPAGSVAAVAMRRPRLSSRLERQLCRYLR
jgi:hypothetical protein